MIRNQEDKSLPLRGWEEDGSWRQWEGLSSDGNVEGDKGPQSLQVQIQIVGHYAGRALGNCILLIYIL